MTRFTRTVMDTTLLRGIPARLSGGEFQFEQWDADVLAVAHPGVSDAGRVCIVALMSGTTPPWALISLYSEDEPEQGLLPQLTPLASCRIPEPTEESVAELIRSWLGGSVTYPPSAIPVGRYS